jgi:signal transduction histidine kinase
MRPVEAPNAHGAKGLDREERFRRLGEVTGELLHDLAGTLGVLTGRVSLARSEARMGRSPGDELARIGADTEELRALVLDVLGELQGLRPPAEVSFPVQATLDLIVNRWLLGAPPLSVTLESDLPENAEIAGPRTFFMRALGNALRAAARQAQREIRISAKTIQSERWVEIRIEDDGDGVPGGLEQEVFEPHISGTKTGTGFGLFFARWGIERLGGSFDLDRARSGLGGASFRVSLPLFALGSVAQGPT